MKKLELLSISTEKRLNIQICYELDILDEHIDKLVVEAEERGLGTSLHTSSIELIARLMMDGGIDTIEQILEDPVNVRYRRIK